MPIRFRPLQVLLLLTAIAVVIWESCYLFSYPVVDTGMWFGDETWTILTLRAMASTGIAHLPAALGSSLAVNNGFVNGVTWISTALYGVPALLLQSVASPVILGRCVTFLLSLGVLGVVYRLQRYLNVEPIIALAMVLLLAVSPVFYFSSHSARLDVATGLAAAIGIWLLVIHYERARTGLPLRFFTLGLLLSLSLTVYVHVPTLLALPCLYAVWHTARDRRDWQRAALGLLSGTLVLAAIYVLRVGSLSLFGETHNQFYDVVNTLPILHPFSWQVQRINTIDRAAQVWSVAFPIILALGVGSIGTLIMRRRQPTTQGFVLILALLVGIGWMSVEGPAVFYVIHVAPLAAVVAGVLLASAAKYRKLLTYCTLVITALAIYVQSDLGPKGDLLSENNLAAIQSIMQRADAPNHPIVLSDKPGWNLLAASPDVRLMTSHFETFGGAVAPVPDIFHQMNVRYLLTYSNRLYRSPLRLYANKYFDFVAMRVGMFTDLGRPYNQTWDPSLKDTMILWRAKW